MGIYTPIIHNRQKAEAMQQSTNGWMNKKMWYIHTIEYYSAFKKEGNSDACCNMNEPWGCYSKQNKPVLKGQMLYDSTNMKY
jgi:hypothetical protein